MGADLPGLGTRLHAAIVESIPELRGDGVILELLRASTESNIETLLHVAQHEIPVEEVLPPSAAIEYARRLAQRGISANALLRAYRIGQSRFLDWVYAEIEHEESDREVAFAAAQMLQATSFAYIDRVAERVVAEYESERERWLANRNTVRAAMLSTVLSGKDYDLGTAESALGYRLRQQHLGLVVWIAESDGVPGELRRLESLVAAIGESAEAEGPALFLPQDRNLAWCWIPLGRTAGTHRLDLDIIRGLTESTGPAISVALGRPHAAGPGFRTTHREAQRAHAVAAIAGDTRVTTFDDPHVQICAILAGDLDSTRSLVAAALGGLAVDEENAAQLRDTLAAFLRAKNSYVAAAQRLHMHKNTVKYRVDKAVEARGRSLDDDRLNLELALTACRYLGPAVLPNAIGQNRA
ncbi:MAG: hypothetical protein HOQ36_21400 [Nocardia sp.]|nr:hypothetical protein [Nocardia sp.]